MLYFQRELVPQIQIQPSPTEPGFKQDARSFLLQDLFQSLHYPIGYYSYIMRSEGLNKLAKVI